MKVHTADRPLNVRGKRPLCAARFQIRAPIGMRSCANGMVMGILICALVRKVRSIQFTTLNSLFSARNGQFHPVSFNHRVSQRKAW